MELVSEDPDRLFSYSTKQEVNVQDRYLGFTQAFLQLGIVTYIVVGIFIYSKGYLEYEQAKGAVATHVKGDVVAVSTGKPGIRYFSAEEISYPGLENGNVFVATRQKVIRQRRGVCEDRSVPCHIDDDCTPGAAGRCAESGFCVEPSWCQLEATPESYELEVSEQLIWVKSSIQFLNLAPAKVYSTEHHHPYPQRGFNLFSVRELLSMSEPAPIRYEEIKALGAAVEVQIIWNCNVNQDLCMPEVKVRRVDTLLDPLHIGFSFAYPEYVSETERVLNELRGVRFCFRTVGTGRKVSLMGVITKASTSGALLGLAPIFADFLMLKVFSLKKKYFARKYDVSPDFSDYMDKLQKSQDEAQQRASENQQEEVVLADRGGSWFRRLHEREDD